MGKFLTADEALKVPNRRFGEVAVPELGGVLRLGSLSAESALQMLDLKEKGELNKDNSRDLLLFMIKEVVVDENGGSLFTEEQAKKLVTRISMETMVDLTEKITDFVHAGVKNRKNSKASPDVA